MAERKKRFSGLYWQQFALTAGMVMLTLLLLGVSFFALSYNYNFTERRDELQERASLIAQVSVDYLKSGGQTEDENLKRFISLGSAMTNAEFLVCNDSGYALLTADQRLGGKVVAIPQEITQEVLTGSGLYQGRSSLGGAYISKQFVVGVPVQDGDQTIGMVLAVMNARSVMGMWRSFISLFLMTSAIILLLVFIVTSLTSMRQIQPIREIAGIVKPYPGCRLHVDATQAVGKTDLWLDGVDTMSFTAHKFYGPNGIGALYKRRGLVIEPQISGGASTTIYRSGTPTLGLAVSLDAALTKALAGQDARNAHVQRLHDRLLAGLQQYSLVRVNSPAHAVPHIVNVSVTGVKGTRFQQALSEQGVCVSVKSACSSDGLPSKAVFAVSRDRRNALSSWRISISHLTTDAEIDGFLQAFDTCYKTLTNKEN